jgi:bifunctional non-homologous end joining protein LigD
MRDLEAYRKKRDPARTPEPFGDEVAPQPLAAGALRRFVLQQHAARRPHFDLRIEVEGVLASWAVPKGPSLDPRERRLAVRTEDHPLAYADFEAVIPAGEYGAGAMIVWDQGTYRCVDGRSPAQGLEDGKLDLALEGHKLRGRFALVRTRRGEGREWLLIRKGEAPSFGREPTRDEPASVLSGLTVEELRDGVTRDAEVEGALRALAPPRRALDRAALRPMLAATAKAPFSRAGWLFELKYDGARVLAVKEAGGAVRLVARSGADRTAVYPEVARAVAKLPLASFVLDGEVVALDERGRSSFERLQTRFTQSDPRAIARAAVEAPAVYYAFDLLGALGFDLRGLPLARRKELLARFAPRLGVVRFADHVEGDGERLFASAAEHGLEGVVAKRADSRYESGRRSPSWQKVKAPRTALLAVVGFTVGRGGRARLGALLLAWWKGSELCYAGSVGSGLDEATIDALLPRLERARVATPPCGGVADLGVREARWVRPELACEVRFTEVTSAGSLRQPVFVALRPERSVAECRAPGERAEEPAAPEPKPRSAARRARTGARGDPPEEPLELTRLEKIFWPVEGYTKGDLLAYYEAVWPWIAPYLRDRPVVLTRYPDGIEGKYFYQQNAPTFTPDWVTRQRIDDTDFFLCNDLRVLLYVVNSGAIPLHVWSARCASLDRPDWLVLDLDPKGAPFADVVHVARHVHALLADLAAPHFLKTSGQDGLHVLLPLGAQLDHDDARSLAEVLARAVCAELPELATIARPLAARGGKVYLDYLQNGRGKLIAAPLSVRPRAGAPVSMPLRFSQLGARLDPERFTIRTAPRLLARGGDPCAGVLEERIDVAGVLGGLEQRLAAAARGVRAARGGPRRGEARAAGGAATPTAKGGGRRRERRR